MRLSQCEMDFPEELIDTLKAQFPALEFRDHFPANFEGYSGNYGDIVLVDRHHNQYSIAVKTGVQTIPVTLWEYDRALYHYENNFGFGLGIQRVGRHIESSIKKRAEKSFSRIASKRTRKEQKNQTRIENDQFKKFLSEAISSYRDYVTQEVISTLNNNEDFKRFVTWQILSGIPHFNYKLPSAKWMFTNSGMYDISSPETPYVVTLADKSTMRAIETSKGIRDKQEGRPFKYNNAIDRLQNEDIELYPAKRFFDKITEIRARVMQLSKKMEVSIFEAMSFISIGVEGEIEVL